MSRFRRLIADRRGNMGVEFAMLAPVLITLLFGTLEIGNLLMLQRKVVAATQSLADLSAQRTEFDSVVFGQFDTAFDWMLDPFTSSRASYAMAHVVFDLDTDGVLVAYDDEGEAWQYDGGICAVLNAAERATGTGREGDAVMVVQVQYDYQPLIGQLIIGDEAPITLTEYALSRPRSGSRVTCSGGDCLMENDIAANCSSTED